MARFPSIPVSDRARAALEAAAAEEGLTLSDYIREAVLASLVRSGHYSAAVKSGSPRARYGRSVLRST